MAYIGQNADGNFTTTPAKDTFNGDGSTVAFTLSQGGSTNTVDVFVENVRQEPTEAYSVDGTTLTFTEAPGTGTGNIYVVNRGPAQLTATHPAGQALEAYSGSFSTSVTAESVTMTGDLTVDGTITAGAGTHTIGDGTGASQVILKASASTNSTIDFGDPDDTNIGRIQYNNTDNAMLFRTNNSERMRIDSSGNLLVGKTARATNTAGIELLGIGASVYSYPGQVMLVNRLTNDGPIMAFAKDGTTVGSIGVASSDSPSEKALFIGTSSSTTLDVGLRFDPGSNQIHPCDANGADRDNAIDLGGASDRFDDIFATNGTIQTSDQNEKQQIAALTTAEVATAKRISALFKTFKWNDSVTDKGSNARTHAGVIAQDVQAAFTAEGLDAGDYALFISSTWWEADEAYTDDDGNAQTRTVTYDTQAEAPAGAIERTRLGIRYPELLAFVGAATEQRLADFETRLTALEASD